MLGDHLADGVGDLLHAGLTHVLHTLHLLLADFRNPDLPVALHRRALNLDHLRLARAVDALAGAGIEGPAARLLDALRDHPTRLLVALGFPAARALTHGLRVLHRLADSVVAVAVAGLVDRLADRVRNLLRDRLVHRLADRVTADLFTGLVHRLADRVANVLRDGLPHGLRDRVTADLFTGLVHRLHDRVADLLRTGLVHRLADRVTADLFTGLVHRLADRVGDFLRDGLIDRLADRVGDLLRAGLVDRLHHGVANVLGLGFPDRLADRVANLLGLGFPDRLADRVADVLRAGLVHRLRDRVVDRLRAGLVHRLADGVGHVAVAGLGDVLDAVDRLGNANALVARLVAGVLLLLVNHLLAGLHHGVALLLAACVVHTAVGLAPTVPSCATIAGVSRISREHCQQDSDQRHTQRGSHLLPPSRTSVTGRAWFCTGVVRLLDLRPAYSVYINCFAGQS